MKKISLSGKDKNVILNMAGAFGVRGLGLVLSLFTLPAHINFFNNDVVLGVWFTLLSVLNWILNFDLGVGNGLRNHLTEAITCDKKDEAKKYISSAYVSIGLMIVAAIMVFLTVFRFVNWNTVFNISATEVPREALNDTVVIVFLGILLQLFLKLISSVIYAMQKAALNNLLGLISSVLTVIALYVLPSSTNDKNLIIMAIVHLLVVNVPLLVATVIIFSTKKYRFMIPSLKFCDFAHSKKVLSLGGRFFFIQIVYMIIMSTNEYIITAFVGSEPVVDYQIYYRIFTLIGTLFAFAMAPVWSSVTKALAEKDFKWISSSFRKIALLSGVCVVGEYCLVFVAQFIINIWLGNDAITVNMHASIAFAFLGSLLIVNSVLSTFANGVGELKTQLIFFCLGAVIKIPIAWVWVSVLNSWVGVVWANVFALLPYCIIQPFWLKRYLSKSNK